MIFYIILFSKCNYMIKIGTDCSGIEAPIEALKKIYDKYDLNFTHIFSSEIDK